MYQVLLLIFPSSQHCSNQSNSLARDSKGCCCAEFGNNSTAAPQGLLVEPCCVAQEHWGSLLMYGSLRASPMGRRCQNQLVVSASNSCLFLGHQQFLVNGASQRKENQVVPIPAFVGISELSDSVIVGANFLLLAEPLCSHVWYT